MSMQQAEDYEAMCLQAEGIENVTSRVFIYDLPAEFKKQLPDARFRAAACVKGWIFHVNVQGQANIRQSFHSEVYPSSDYLLAGPCRKSIYDPTRKNFDVLGLIYDLTPEQAASCEKYFHIDRNRVDLIATIEDRETLEVQRIAVFAYVDLRNTADGFQKVFPDDPTNRLYKLWKLNFGMFEQAGISKAYLNATFKQLLGKSIPYPEPIYVAPALLSQYPDHVSSFPASVTHPCLDATSSQSPQARHVAQPPFQGSSQITWQYVGITKFKAYFEASIDACPNDTVCQKLEDQYNAGLKSYREHQEQLLAQRQERLKKQRVEEQWSDEGECTTDEEEQLKDEEEQLIEQGEQLTHEDEWLTEEWLTEEGGQLIDDEDLLTEEWEQLTDDEDLLTEKGEQLTHGERECMTDEEGQLTDKGEQLIDDEELLTEEDELSTDEEELLIKEEERLSEEEEQLTEEDELSTDEEELLIKEVEEWLSEEEEQLTEEEKQRAKEKKKLENDQKLREIWAGLVKRVREQNGDNAAAKGEARGRTHPAKFNSARKSLSLDSLPVMGEFSAPRSRFSGQARPQVYPPQSQDPHAQQPRRTEPSLQAPNAQLPQVQKGRTQVQQPGSQIQQIRPQVQQTRVQQPQHSTGGQNPAQRIPAGPQSQHPLAPQPISHVQAPPRQLTPADLPGPCHYSEPIGGGSGVFRRVPAGEQGQYAQTGPQGQHILSRPPQSTNGGQDSAQQVPPNPQGQHAQPTNGERVAFQQLLASVQGQRTPAGFPQSTNGSQNPAQRLPANLQGQYAQPTNRDRDAFQQLLASVRAQNIGKPLPQPLQPTNAGQSPAQQLLARPQQWHYSAQPINGSQLPTSRPSQANLPGPQSMNGLQSSTQRSGVGLQGPALHSPFLNPYAGLSNPTRNPQAATARLQASQPHTRNPLHSDSFYNDAQPSSVLQQPRPQQPRPQQPHAASTPSPGRQAPRGSAPQPEDESRR
ncbi:putative reticulocyte binding protein 2 [Drepanopeziza brunnea f. sp. 'multigermtubi' MB_m1]|uniref:Putative reticulocyte binding protein 2 n=1 Tax=Marssonina brunnea f. sp. multigermtubi (strain MB_m1) TaxID=1072389 RepID=K1WND1_MARBU|nr:putative reticulocyte binding protein 2 [Drepanopeziza brunnea f. sp. 'multigermtubi' MB_m1]EKD14446.1 putative reticulocyte binding protein 2 [Drepanopeziza brunnea f. sp. 'multigermtubi' MB_m1]